MKKWISVVLCIAMVLCISGCKNQKAKQPQPEAYQTQELVNDENLKFSVPWVGFVPGQGYVMQADMENLRGLSMHLSIVGAALNGCMCNPQWDYILEVEEKTSVQIIFPEEMLVAYGINEVTKIQFDLMVDDPEEEESNLLTKTCVIYPQGEAMAKVQVRQAQKTDVVLVDNEYCTISLIGKEAESFYGFELQLYTVNKTNEPIHLTMENEKLNGVTCDGFWMDSDLQPGTSGISTLYWFENRMEGIDGKSITSVTMKLLADKQVATLGELFTQEININL